MIEDKIPTKEEEIEQLEHKESYSLKIRKSIDNIKEEYKRLILTLILLLFLIYAIFLLVSSISHITDMDSEVINESVNEVYNEISK